MAKRKKAFRRFSDEQRAEMVRRYIAGERLADIARECGVSHGYVSQLAGKLGHKRVPHNNAIYGTADMGG